MELISWLMLCAKLGHIEEMTVENNKKYLGEFMKKFLFVLGLSILIPHLVQAEACSQEQIQQGCKTTEWEHCYPKTGDCVTIISCSCKNPRFISPATERFQRTGNHSSGGFTGVRCGPPSRRTGDITCCHYEDGTKIFCTTH